MKTYRYYVHCLNVMTNYELAKQFGFGEDNMRRKAQCVVRRSNRAIEMRVWDIYQIDEQQLEYLRQNNPTMQYVLLVQEGNGQIRTFPVLSRKKKPSAKVITADKMLAGV